MDYRLDFCILCVVGILSGCLSERTEHSKQTAQNGFALEDARRFFETQPQTRSSETVDEEHSLYPGEFSAHWEQGGVWQGDLFAEAEVQINSDYTQYIVAGDKGQELVPTYGRLAVICDKSSGEMAAVLKVYIPTIDSAEPLRNYADADFNDGAYRGLVIYATLAGEPFAIAKFDGCRFVQSAWITDERYSSQENLERMRMLGGDMLVTSVSRVQTRGVNDNNLAEPVVIIAYRPDRPLTVFSNMMIASQFLEERAGIGGGGGSGSSGGASQGAFVQGTNVFTDSPRVKQFTEQLSQDCLGKKLLALLDRKISVNAGSGTGSQYQRITDGSKVVSETITIGNESPDIAFLEELIHAYQNTNNFSGKNDHRLNDEIEAKLGWAMYALRQGVKLDDYANYLGGAQGVRAFDLLMTFPEFGFSLFNPVNFNLYQDVYYDIVYIFRQPNSPYNNAVKYPFSSTVMKFDNLEQLMADC